MNDVQQSAFFELRRLIARVNALESQIEQFRRGRVAYSQVPDQVRWCVTISDDDEELEDPYPVEDANVFPIRFIDTHFVATAGVQAFEQDARSTGRVTWAHAGTGRYVPVNVPLPCFLKRGLGPEGSGEWWLLDPPLMLFGKLAETLAADGVADMTVWLLGTGGWEASAAVIPVKDWFLRFAEDTTELEAGTGLAVFWYGASGTNAKYVVLQASCLPTDFFEAS